MLLTFVNLAAGWLQRALFFTIIRPAVKFNFWVLTVNIMSAILSLIVAFKLRKSLTTQNIRHALDDWLIDVNVRAQIAFALLVIAFFWSILLSK